MKTYFKNLLKAIFKPKPDYTEPVCENDTPEMAEYRRKIRIAIRTKSDVIIVDRGTKCERFKKIK